MTEEKPINGKAIYTPKGAALEYGRTGCNFYTGCPHECEYCYLKRGITGKALGGTVVQLKKMLKDPDTAITTFRKELWKYIDECRKHGIFFSFTTDPMIPDTIELTMQALLFLQDMGIPSYILTKNADFIDYELFRTYMMGLNVRSLLHFGFTLTGRDDMEPKASLNADRIATMKRLKLHFGCHTWASIEPVIDWKSAERVVLASIPYCDHYKIGLRSGVKKDYYDHAETFERVSFLVEVITRAYRDVYLKQSVRTFIGNDYNVTLEQFESLVARTVDMDGNPFIK